MTGTVLITGGSRGIGRATALLAARDGWDVVLTYRRAAGEAAAVVGEIQSGDRRALAVQADVASERDIVRAFEEATAFGGLAGVVINAGMVQTAMPLADMTADRIARMFAINTTGAYLTAREAARRLPDGSSIVVTSSAAARLGSPGEFVDYAGAKAALDTMIVGLSKELGSRGIRVNAVRPGLIETDIHADGGNPDRARQLADGVPLRRAGSAEEVAEALVWLLSDKASYVTGAVLDVTGGR